MYFGIFHTFLKFIAKLWIIQKSSEIKPTPSLSTECTESLSTSPFISGFQYYYSLPKYITNTHQFHQRLQAPALHSCSNVSDSQHYSSHTTTHTYILDQCKIGIEMEVGFHDGVANRKEWNSFLQHSSFSHAAFTNYTAPWKTRFCVKTDISVPKGIELAFYPMSVHQLLYEVDWTSLLHFFKRNSGVIRKDNSLQIHLPYSCLQPISLHPIATFLYKHRKLMIEFMRRESFYAVFPNYTQYSTLSLEERFTYHTKYFAVHDNHYYDTIELRGFNMTLNPTILQEYFQFAYYLLLYHNGLMCEETLLHIIRHRFLV